MKTLYFLRHAKSDWDNPRLTDFNRPLAPRGRRDAPRMAAFIRDADYAPDSVLCSAAQRARETWRLMAPILDGDLLVKTENDLYMASPTQLIQRLRALPDDCTSVLLIGHNPGLQRCALDLCPHGDIQARDTMARKYPTAALAVMAFEITRWAELGEVGGHLKTFVRPKDLAEHS